MKTPPKHKHLTRSEIQLVVVCFSKIHPKTCLSAHPNTPAICTIGRSARTITVNHFDWNEHPSVNGVRSGYTVLHLPHFTQPFRLQKNRPQKRATGHLCPGPCGGSFCCRSVPSSKDISTDFFPFRIFALPDFPSSESSLWRDAPNRFFPTVPTYAERATRCQHLFPDRKTFFQIILILHSFSAIFIRESEHIGFQIEREIWCYDPILRPPSAQERCSTEPIRWIEAYDTATLHERLSLATCATCP
jgi:hypothetical protein